MTGAVAARTPGLFLPAGSTAQSPYDLVITPETAGWGYSSLRILTLEPGGWVPLAPVLAHLRVRREDVERVVAGSDKGRFALQGERIRANQGHSVPVDLHLTPLAPPATLYHGTHPGALDAIRAGGLRPMNRHHVLLSRMPAKAL